MSRIFAASTSACQSVPSKLHFSILSADATSVRIQLSIVNVSRMRAFRSSNPHLSCSLSFSLFFLCFASNVPCSNPCFYFGTPSIRDWTERLWKSENNKIDADETDRAVCTDNRWQWEQWEADACVLFVCEEQRSEWEKIRKFLCPIKSRTYGDTVMVHGVVWWFSGADNRNFDNACYVTHEGWWVSYVHLFS